MGETGSRGLAPPPPQTSVDLLEGTPDTYQKSDSAWGAGQLHP